MQFAGVDSSSPPVIDIPRQCMELLDLEKPTPDACAEPRLGQVAEQEFGLEDAAQVPIGAVETVLGAEAYQPFQGHRDCDVACLERGVELTHAVPLLGNLLSVDGLVGAADQRCKRTVVAVGIDAVDALVLDSSDARSFTRRHNLQVFLPATQTLEN